MAVGDEGAWVADSLATNGILFESYDTEKLPCIAVSTLQIESCVAGRAEVEFKIGARITRSTFLALVTHQQQPSLRQQSLYACRTTSIFHPLAVQHGRFSKQALGAGRLRALGLHTLPKTEGKKNASFAVISSASLINPQMRCIGADNPPCARCAKAGRECIIQPSRRGLQKPAGTTTEKTRNRRPAKSSRNSAPRLDLSGQRIPDVPLFSPREDSGRPEQQNGSPFGSTPHSSSNDSTNAGAQSSLSSVYSTTMLSALAGPDQRTSGVSPIRWSFRNAYILT